MALDRAAGGAHALIRTLAGARVTEQLVGYPKVIGGQHAIAKFMHGHAEKCAGCPRVEPDTDDTEPSGGLDPHGGGELAGHLTSRLTFDAGSGVAVNGIAGIEEELDAAVGENRVGGRSGVEAVTVEAPDALHEARGCSANGMLGVFHGLPVRWAISSRPSANRR